MKSIRLNSVINSIRAKVDGSLGMTLSTPELSSSEKADIMNIQGINLDTFLKPLDSPIEATITIDKDIEQKTQSQRIRNVLYLLWQQEGENGDFNNYYRQKTEKYIQALKERLN